MSKKYEILRPKEYSGRQIALPEEEFWELAKDLEDMKLEISTLEKENQELKDKLSIHMINIDDRKLTKWEKNIWHLINSKYSRTMGQYSVDSLLLLIEQLDIKLKKQQDQFLKVVESVIKEHPLKKSYWDSFLCGCGIIHSIDYHEHLLWEIKSAIEKGKDGR